VFGRKTYLLGRSRRFDVACASSRPSSFLAGVPLCEIHGVCAPTKRKWMKTEHGLRLIVVESDWREAHGASSVVQWLTLIRRRHVIKQMSSASGPPVGGRNEREGRWRRRNGSNQRGASRSFRTM
jgi:hypothetical protein